ncbi:MAG: polyribonucleotide nucleotidyltransferase [bacterium]|nr:polyribonucleotide nucleotidyltransferase [bacterium]
MKVKKYTTDFAGRTLTAEFSNLAEQANGSVLLRYGETVVFATAVMSAQERQGLDYFPLTVDYEERFYAAGEILGSRFLRREGRPSEGAILTSRLIDRTIRPLFNQKTRNETQVTATAMAVDGENDSDIVAIIAASLALGTSNIPWNGPIGAVRIGYPDFKVNPTYAEREKSNLDLIVCGKDGQINMMEAEANEVPEKIVSEAFDHAVKEIEKIQKWQEKIFKEIGKPKRTITVPEEPEKLEEAFKKHFHKRLEDAIFEKRPASDLSEKTGLNLAIQDLKTEWLESMETEFGESIKNVAEELFEESINEIIHLNAIKEGRRPDGRKPDELRHIFADINILPRVHGSGLFYRGSTHILSVVTLGAPGDVQLIEGMEIKMKKRFMHHYNFPPFSSGETGRMGNPGRREIGHGALAERALMAVMPTSDIFPYTVRVVSECLSSNGSTSQGSICASTLALMAAGVPIKNPVAGISIGIMINADEYKLLTDIQGPEDHHGDMDFKVAGTKDGITAIQMDVKVDGIKPEILKEALERAKKARMEILDVMLKTISEPAKELSPQAPRVIKLTINPDKIRDVVGPGGKVINKIIADTGADIDIEQDGTIFVTGKNEEGANKAIEIIKQITHEYQVGEICEKGIVSRIFEFGAMVEIAPKTEGLVHISELASFRVARVTDVVNIGDVIPVKIISIDEMGRINLSLKAVDPNYARTRTKPAADNGETGRNESRPPSRQTDHGNYRSGGRPGTRRT